MTQKSSPTPLEIILYVVGGLGLLYGVWKGYIDGFYPDELPGLLAAFFIAGGALLVASRMAQARQREYDSARDRARGVE